LVASADDAGKTLANYLDIIRKAVLRANEQQKNALSVEARAKMPKRVISGVMNALVSHELRTNLSNLPGIVIRQPYAQTQIIFSSEFLMKCKLSKRKRISFIQTRLMLDFMNQLQSAFPDMPSPVTNIVLTYEWNDARTEIVRISIDCPANETDYYWTMEIPLEATAQTVPPQIPQLPPQLPSETQRIKPKANRIKKSKKGITKDEQGKENQQ
jgi:hypothetical protein